MDFQTYLPALVAGLFEVVVALLATPNTTERPQASLAPVDAK